MLSLSTAALLAFALAKGARAVTNETGHRTVEQVSAAWYAGWHSDDFPLSAVSWDKYTQLTYSFAITQPDGSLSLSGSDGELLPQFVSTAHQHGVKASVSIGGWTGSLYYSSSIGSAANRTAFVKTVTDFATKYHLDALDFDWEYPGRQGIGCNTISPNDTSNFLSFLQELRSTSVGKSLTLSAAVSLTPFADASGNPSSNVKAFASVLDYIEVMDYDVWGSWSNAVGPNAPLNDTCAPTDDQDGSAVSAVQAWTAAGMPPSQIVLGVPAYGHSFRVTKANATSSSSSALAAYPPFVAGDQPAGDKWDDQPGTDVCGNFEGQGGLWDFWGLIDGGFLTSNGSVADGILSRFDDCSKTAYVYNSTSEVMVSYDSAQTFLLKGQFIKTTGLRGFAMWEAGGDSDDILLDSILSGMGATEDDC